jgi:methyl-accepting chemotaxis protein
MEDTMTLSLKNRILLPTLLLVIIGMGISTTVSYFSSKKALDEACRSQIKQLADSAEDALSIWMSDRRLDIATWSEQKIYQTSVKDTFVGKAARKTADAQLAKLREKYQYYEAINVTDAKGDIVSSTNPELVGKLNVAERIYFQEASKDKIYQSDVLISKTSGKPVFMIAAPIKEKDEVAGVFFGVIDLDSFTKIFIDSVKIGQNGYAYLYQEDGFVIAHPDKSNILKLNMKQFDFGREMMTKDGGLITYTWKGVEKIVAFGKEKATGWTVGVGAATSDLMASVEKVGYINLTAAVAVVALAVVVTFLIAGSIAKGINSISGNLGEGVTSVALASSQFATSSQQLAEGASEQAASIEETSASLEEMSSMTKTNADNAAQANGLMQEANQVVSQAYGSMDQLTNSMADISKASEETSKIIKTIDEIAFQTNLLALNAAVEAARAGEAGAGFAVVADEVRNLAMRAADAAKNTSDLIEGTVTKIKDGSDLVTRTHGAFSEVATHSKKVGELVAEIAAASNEQAQGIEQVNTAVTEMDRVVQQNAANAEESASASETMNTQADRMKARVDELLALVAGSRKVSKIEDTHQERPVAAPASIAKKEDGKDSRPGTDEKLDAKKIIPMEEDDFKDF